MPAPARKMGFGGLLVQDSDEEGKEVGNGAGKMLYLPVDGGEWGTAKGEFLAITDEVASTAEDSQIWDIPDSVMAEVPDFQDPIPTENSQAAVGELKKETNMSEGKSAKGTY
ncbi:UNVERIFIED_CONTAM: hypothetical protein K2H54_070462 [Gekko kuhli]